MTKILEIDIDKYQVAPYLSAIRSKQHVVIIWMETIKNYLINQQPKADQAKAKLTIEIEATSRLYCQLDDGKKIFSIAFPFGVVLKDQVWHFYSREGIQIDNRISSLIISLVRHSRIFDVQDFSSFIDPIFDMSEYDSDIWSLMRELMLAEDAYMRYDWDMERQNGHIHPLHHLDIYYSSAGTFKLGLDQRVERTDLSSILNAQTACHYLKPAA